MNIITIMLPFFNFWDGGLMYGTSYVVEEPKKKKKKSLKPSQKRKSSWKGLYSPAGDGLRMKTK